MKKALKGRNNTAFIVFGFGYNSLSGLQKKFYSFTWGDAQARLIKAFQA